MSIHYEKESLDGLYAGVVEDNADPEQLGRLRVRVPHVYGPTGAAGAISKADLPWALPCGLPAGGSAKSGGISWLPEPGDQVFVQFLDTEPEKPVWLWGNQTRRQKSSFGLHKYKDNVPERAVLTRYGHSLEWNSTSIIGTSKSGYAIILDNGTGKIDGNVNLTTPAGQSVTLDDKAKQLTILVKEIQANVDKTVSIIGSDFDLEASKSDFSVTAKKDIELDAGKQMKLSFVKLKMGDATEPFVLGNQLVSFLDALLLYLTTHTHSNGNDGEPTGPPIIDPNNVVQPTTSDLVSASILGE